MLPSTPWITFTRGKKIATGKQPYAIAREIHNRAAAGGGPGAALGAAIGGATGAIGGVATTPPPYGLYSGYPGYNGYSGYYGYPSYYGYPGYGYYQ